MRKEDIWIQQLRKETNSMDLGNAKIIVGDKIYPATTVEFEQTLDETYPTVEISAYLNPHRASWFINHPTHISIKNVIFNPPATIVFWSDNTKTVVKCDYEQEPYDPEKGLAMAISKKMLGDNKYEYYNTFLHWLKKWDRQQRTTCQTSRERPWNGDMCDA